MQIHLLKERASLAGLLLTPETEEEQKLLLRLQRSRPWIDFNPGKFPASLSLVTKEWNES